MGIITNMEFKRRNKYWFGSNPFKRRTQTKTLELLVPSGISQGWFSQSYNMCGLPLARRKRLNLLWQFQSKVVKHMKNAVTYLGDNRQRQDHKDVMAKMTGDGTNVETILNFSQSVRKNTPHPARCQARKCPPKTKWVRRADGEWVRRPGAEAVASGKESKPETRRLLLEEAELTQPEIPQLESSSVG